MRRRKKDPWLDGSVPLTQDFADAVHSLAGAAEILDGIDSPRAKLIKEQCFREMQMILCRGRVPDANAPKAPSTESVHSLKSPPADSSPGSERK